MNIEQAKTIPITTILERIGVHPVRENERDIWFKSPLRNENTASFHVKPKENIWYDFGEGVGGDVLSFVCIYLERYNEDHTVSDALRWIRNMSGMVHDFAKFPKIVQKNSEERKPSLVLKSSKGISHQALIQYLEKRGIPLTIASQYLKELHVQNKQTGKSFFALGFPNEENGFEIRTPFFQGSLGKKTITFIRGSQAKPSGIHLFEGFTDYLTAISTFDGNRFKDDTIILNSVSCLKHAIPYIHNYGYQIAYTWMDNDFAGAKATHLLEEFFKSEESLKHVKMNNVYAPHKDVNAWHMYNLNLS